MWGVTPHLPAILVFARTSGLGPIAIVWMKSVPKLGGSGRFSWTYAFIIVHQWKPQCNKCPEQVVGYLFSSAADAKS